MFRRVSDLLIILLDYLKVIVSRDVIFFTLIEKQKVGTR